MSADGIGESRSGLWTSVLSLCASSSTLVCCAMPALPVAIGAGAALSSVVSVFPQLVWLSEHKGSLFGLAGLAIAVSGVVQWHNRTAPCPTDRAPRQACLKTRKASQRVYGFSVVICLVGAWRIAFVQPWLAGSPEI
jgi:hypothetical protein